MHRDWTQIFPTRSWPRKTPFRAPWADFPQPSSFLLNSKARYFVCYWCISPPDFNQTSYLDWNPTKSLAFLAAVLLLLLQISLLSTFHCWTLASRMILGPLAHRRTLLAERSELLQDHAGTFRPSCLPCPCPCLCLSSQVT